MRRTLSSFTVFFALSILLCSCAPFAADALHDDDRGVRSSRDAASTAELGVEAAGGPKSMVCSLPDQRLYFFEGDQLVYIMRCSTGLNDSTPKGRFSILNHHLTHGVIWGGVCDYWMGFTASHGIHAWPRGAAPDYETMLGSPASPGCITLHPRESYWPYYWAPDGTPLTVTSDSLAGMIISGCHSAMGTQEPSRDWYFAEGYTAEGFDTYLLMANPGGGQIEAVVSFFLEGGGEVSCSYSLAPHTRFTLPVDGLPELVSAAFSAYVHADGPIVAERAVYFGKGYIGGGHAAMGIDSLSNTWYFAEGCTGDLFETYLLLGNPGEEDAVVDIDYYTPEGSIGYRYLAGAHCRTTISINTQPGLEGKDVSCTLRSDHPLFAERAVYYDLDSHRGGHASPGATAPAKDWYFAEGYCDGAFDTYFLLSNPGFTTARAELTLECESGSVFVYAYEVSAQRRLTVHVDELPGMARAAFATHISSDEPVVAERAMYFEMKR
jgi:hypothetical protein